MVFLACRNFDPSPSRLDLVASRCRWSSNRCGMSSVNRFSFRNYGMGVDTGACKLAWIRPGIAGAGCRVSSFQTPQSRLSVVAQDSASTLDVSPKPRSPVSVSNLLQVVSDDLRTLNQNLKSITGADDPVLVSAAEQIFSAGGKRLRPALVFLVSRATTEIAGIKELTLQHQRLAEIIEMIHTASLIHDDVIDDSNIRRGKDTIHQLYGTRMAVLTGDFMFAQSSWHLANLENIEVIKLISQVIKDFASGEIKQASSLFDCDVKLEEYLIKSYYKTASLIAASTKAAAIFSGVDGSICEKMFEYGRNLGLSFQVVDDILDFTQSKEQLGKPAVSDLEKGNLTAPVIFALEKEPKLREIIESEFVEDGSLDEAIELVNKCGGIDRARDLAKETAKLAIQSLQCLPVIFRPSHCSLLFSCLLESEMKVIAAYLLAVLGGNLQPSADDLKTILGSVGAEAEDDRIELLLTEVKGKDITELIASGREKLASVPSGGGVAVAVSAGGGAGAGAAAAPAAAESKKEEKVEEKEESDEDMGFSLFD